MLSLAVTLDAATHASPAPTREEDHALVRAAGTGDMRAFEALYRKHSRRVYAVLWRLCGHEARAEDLGQDAKHRETYDWAVARAVANLNVLSEYLLPLVKIGGTALAQKGESGPAEAQSAEQAMNVLGGKLRQLIPVHLPGVVEERYLVAIEKVAATPPKYPRKPGTPAKQPL